MQTPESTRPRFALTLAKTLWIAFPTFAVLLGLRLYLKLVLQRKFGWVGMTDFDLAVPSLVGLFAFFLSVESTSSIVLRVSRKALAITALATLLFVGLNHAFDHVAAWSPWFSVCLWMGLVVSIVTSSLGIFVNPSTFLKREHLPVALACLLITSTLVLHNNHLYDWLRWSYAPTASLACTLGQVLTGNVMTCVTEGMQISLKHPNFVGVIARECGGAEGILLFLCAWIYYVTTQPRKLGLSGGIIGLVAGTAMMLLLNAIRIAAIFSLTVFLMRNFGKDFGMGFFRLFFHTHAGWVIYAIGIGVFLRVASRIRRGSALAPSKSEA